MRNVKSIVVDQYGGPEVLVLHDRNLRAPNNGEVLVCIRMVGVNFVDIYWRNGFDPQPLPFIPGLEASGVPGSYAEACIVPADRLICLPDDLSFEQGAAFPLQGMTAHYLIYEFRKPGAGDIVLIHAAAGGVEMLLVQWAHHLGAHVIGCVSTSAKAEIATQAGAHDVILYNTQNFALETMRIINGHGADIIFDGVGKTTFNLNMQAAALRGHIVIFGATSGAIDPLSPTALMERSLTLSGGDFVIS